MLIDILKALGLVLLINPAFTYLLIILILTCIYNYLKKIISKK
jgi:4-hydroxybenzoate polyprenyltransferase